MLGIYVVIICEVSVLIETQIEIPGITIWYFFCAEFIFSKITNSKSCNIPHV